MARPSARESIILAAEEIVQEVGANRLTLEAVAERAGMSKGGLLYHFPSKEALLVAMLERLMEDYHTRRQTVFEGLPEGPGRGLRTHITVGMGEPCGEEDSSRCKVACALIAAMANAPDLLSPVRPRIVEIIRKLASRDGAIDPKKAIILLAVDGFKFWEMLKLSPLTDPELDAIMAELLRMAAEVGEPDERMP